jgi:hypothetical protein
MGGRCRGALAPLLQAAAAVGEVSLEGARNDGALLAALRPAAGTLSRLVATRLRLSDEVCAVGTVTRNYLL